MPEFCLKFLNCNYKAFQYRVREGRCNPNEIIFISWFLGETVEDLFGKPFTGLMIGQGEAKVSEKALELFHQADPRTQARLMGLLGPGFPLGVSAPEIGAGVSTDRINQEVEAGRLMVPGPVAILPGLTVTPKDKHVPAVKDRTQKKAPPISEAAPKPKPDPFEALQDFSLSR